LLEELLERRDEGREVVTRPLLTLFSDRALMVGTAVLVVPSQGLMKPILILNVKAQVLVVALHALFL
jgi:hypothetical protein